MICRQAVIVSSESRGPSFDDDLLICSAPDREVIEIEGLNCTTQEFIDWFLETDENGSFCACDQALIDVGGSNLDLSVGQVLSVTSDAYFEVWLDRKVRYAERAIDTLVRRACVSLDITLSCPPPEPEYQDIVFLNQDELEMVLLNAPSPSHPGETQ